MDSKTFNYLVSNQDYWRELYIKKMEDELKQRKAKYALYRKNFPENVKASRDRFKGLIP